MTIDEIIFAIIMITVVGIVLWDIYYGEPVIEEDENDHFY
jgi:hypothetical protein